MRSEMQESKKNAATINLRSARILKISAKQASTAAMQNKISQPFRESRLLTVSSCFPKTPAVNTITNPVLSLFHEKNDCCYYNTFFPKNQYSFAFCVFLYMDDLSFWEKTAFLCKKRLQKQTKTCMMIADLPVGGIGVWA